MASWMASWLAGESRGQTASMIPVLACQSVKPKAHKCTLADHQQYQAGEQGWEITMLTGQGWQITMLTEQGWAITMLTGQGWAINTDSPYTLCLQWFHCL